MGVSSIRTTYDEMMNRLWLLLFLRTRIFCIISDLLFYKVKYLSLWYSTVYFFSPRASSEVKGFTDVTCVPQNVSSWISSVSSTVAVFAMTSSLTLSFYCSVWGFILRGFVIKSINASSTASVKGSRALLFLLRVSITDGSISFSE